jgi:Ferritin-like domain
VTSTRRQLLGRGIGIAGAAALPTSLLTAAPAFAQEDEETDALERLVELEQASELAYALAVEEGNLDSDVERAFELFGGHNGEHDTALSEAVDQLGVDPPDAASDPADYEALADFDAGADQKDVLEFMIGLEEDLVAAYEEETANLEAEDLVRSAAQIGASHAQQLVALRLLAGEPPGRLTLL